jgi:ornithine carbamoyltransferase
MIRAIKHSDVEELAKYSDVPVINGLTDLEHPCQALADMLTIKEHLGDWEGKKICFVGDGNNVSNSLLLIAPLLGMDMSLACPKGYEPNEKIVETAQEYAEENNTEIIITDDIGVALENVDAVFTDVWVSMGDEAEAVQRQKDFAPFQVNKDLMSLANDGAIFMHCLPAIRGQEVTAEVIDGPQSVIYDEAENRMHAQKAVLYHYLK